jgi:hypothetical protein
MNEFVKNLMDPFNNSIASMDQNFDSYYDEYYNLYNIKPNELEINPKEFKLKKIFNPKSYFSSEKVK